jgi:hypothetical protein
VTATDGPGTVLVTGGASGLGAAGAMAVRAALNRPEDVAEAVLFALSQPPGCETRELVVCPSTESSWP